MEHISCAVVVSTYLAYRGLPSFPRGYSQDTPLVLKTENGSLETTRGGKEGEELHEPMASAIPDLQSGRLVFPV